MSPATTHLFAAEIESFDPGPTLAVNAAGRHPSEQLDWAGMILRVGRAAIQSPAAMSQEEIRDVQKVPYDCSGIAGIQRLAAALLRA